jgi:uncharacterized protein YdaT
MDYMRDFFFRATRDLICSITYANTIYPISLKELELRREMQTRAIGICEMMLQELYFISRVLRVNISKFMPVVSRVEREISLLKGWRKSDHRFRKAIKNDEKNDPTLPALRRLMESFIQFITTEEFKQEYQIDFSEIIYGKENTIKTWA